MRRGTPAISRSIGSATRRSISSGAWPGYWAITWTWTSCTSGNASIRRLSAARTPNPTSATTSTSTNTRCDRQNVTIRSSIGGRSRGAQLLRGLGQLGVQQQRSSHHDALARDKPGQDVRRFRGLERKAQLPPLELARRALDESECVQPLGDERLIRHPHRALAVLGEQRGTGVHL